MSTRYMSEKASGLTPASWRATVKQLWSTFLALRVPATIPARTAIWITALYAVGQGIGICIGGIGRWGGPGYAVVRQLPGSPYSWGVTLILFGLLLAVASIRRSWGMKAAAILSIVVWNVAFSYGAFAATASGPLAGTTGGPVYLFAAALTTVLVMYDEGQYPCATD